FYLNKALSIYGGLDGTEDHNTFDLNNRVFADDGTTMANQAILSGNIGSSCDNTDNAYHILLAQNASGAIVLDGFTISEGNATGSGSATINRASIPRSQGAGMIVMEGTTVTLRNNVFRNNIGTQGGGAMRVTGTSSANSHITLANVFFEGNSTTASHGGALFCLNATINIDRSRFVNNSGATNSGGIWIQSSTASVKNSLFYGNRHTGTSGGGGAIGIQSSVSTTILGTTIYGNTSVGSDGGGAIRFAGTNNNVKIYNSIIYGNTSASGAQDVAGSPSSSTFEMKNTITQAFSTSDNTGNLVWIGADPAFVAVPSDPSSYDPN